MFEESSEGFGGSFPPDHGFMRCDPGSSDIRHGDKRLGVLIRARPCHPWRTGEGIGVLS